MPVTKSRRRLSSVLRRGGDLISVDEATDELGIGRTAAAKLLARWHQQGWLKRIRRGLYAPVALTSMPEDQVLEDPWILVPALFDPGYVGGASAAQFWDLTEQLFRSVFVYTGKPVRRTNQTIQAVQFVVRHLRADLIFGVTPSWHGRIKVQVSDVHRTMIDMLDQPAAGGGIRQVNDCLLAYFRRPDADTAKLVKYAELVGNGAIFKRLGFLAERINAPENLIRACAERLTSGNVRLDPALESFRLVRRWRLWVPDSWKRKPDQAQRA
jgi:predicted transcriptional regulator of viral defense system